MFFFGLILVLRKQAPLNSSVKGSRFFWQRTVRRAVPPIPRPVWEGGGADRLTQFGWGRGQVQERWEGVGQSRVRVRAASTVHKVEIWRDSTAEWGGGKHFTLKLYCTAYGLPLIDLYVCAHQWQPHHFRPQHTISPFNCINLQVYCLPLCASCLVAELAYGMNEQPSTTVSSSNCNTLTPREPERLEAGLNAVFTQ